MPKRLTHFKEYSDYIKKRSRGIFDKKLTPLLGEGTIASDGNVSHVSIKVQL